MATVEYWRAKCEAQRRVRSNMGMADVVAAPAPDYATGMLKLGIGMHHLEEALPNKQVGRIVPALGALLEGVADLLAWSELGAHLSATPELPKEAYARLVGLIAQVAENDGVIVTCIEVPLKPLAMGHYQLEAVARLAHFREELAHSAAAGLTQAELVADAQAQEAATERYRMEVIEGTVNALRPSGPDTMYPAHPEPGPFNNRTDAARRGQVLGQGHGGLLAEFHAFMSSEGDR